LKVFLSELLDMMTYKNEILIDGSLIAIINKEI